MNDVKENLNYDFKKSFKTLAFVANARNIFITLHAEDKIDFKKLLKIIGVKRNEIAFMKLDALEHKLGYVRGGVSPIPISKNIESYIDEKIKTFDNIYCGIGDNDKTLEIDVEFLLKVSYAKIVDISLK